MLVEEVGGPVQADRGLAGARSALDHHDPVQWSPNDDVLLGLNSADDVPHGAGAGPLQLVQQRVGHAAAAGQPVLVGLVQQLVEDVGELAALGGEPPPAMQAHRVAEGGPVERH